MEADTNTSLESQELLPRKTGIQPVQVLLIEDNPSDAEIIKALLAEADDRQQFWLVHVKKLSTGLKVISRNVFDAVLLDLSLPDSEGNETVERIRKAVPELPIIVLTGLDDHHAGIRAIRSGAQEYLVKGSVDGNGLSRVIHYAIERHKIFTDLKVPRITELYTGDHDRLTDLPSRKLFYYRLDHSLSKAERNSKQVALLMLNLDGFRNINLGYGRIAGDTVLKTVAQRLRSLFREGDTVARFWGDQFAIILYGINTFPGAVLAAKKVLRSVSLPIGFKGEELHLTGCVGISVFPTDSANLEALIHDSQEALVEAKKMGSHQYCFSSPVRNALLKESRDMEDHLAEGLKNQQFEMHYQPYFEVKTGELLGMEALMRWKQSSGEMVPAKDFIGIAERSGLLVPMTEWAIRKVCEEMTPWLAAGYLRGSVSINLSASLVTGDELFEMTERILQETGFDPRYLAFEISELTALEFPMETLHLIQKLKNLGLQIIVDNFGTGAISLSYLKKSRASLLKIDRSLVSQLPNDSNNAAFTTAIVKVANTLSLKVVATGVENSAQLKFIKELACEGVQGNFAWKPQPLKDFTHQPLLDLT